jgi:hypothetical protein
VFVAREQLVGVLWLVLQLDGYPVNSVEQVACDSFARKGEREGTATECLIDER